MQLLHECRENGHDHFERLKRHRQIPLQYKHSSNQNNNDDFELQNHEAILEHLESISSCNSQNMARSRCNVLDCVLSAEASGMYDLTKSTIPESSISETDTSFLLNDLEEIKNNGFTLEELWKNEYELRRDKYKQRTSNSGVADPIPSVSDNSSSIAHTLSDGSELRNALQNKTPSISMIAQNILPTTTENYVDIDAMIKKFTLNTEQARAFKLVCEQSLNRENEPLRLYLGGAGGTGKSRVIHALKDFFIQRGQERRLRLTAFTGVAAQHISGMTIHAALHLNEMIKTGPQSKTNRDLQIMWEGVDFLFIDEVSMIGCKLLHRISEALIQAKGNTSPFGGINVIFSGDFAQLPPVGETRLSADVNTSNLSTEKKGIKNDIVYGKLLWLSVNQVIILTENMRQSGTENINFVKLLSRLREGCCTQDDHDLLSKRILHNTDVNWEVWADTPIIVSDNAQKDALNERGAQAFANRNNKELHWYYAVDTHRKTPVSSDIKNHLNNMHSGLTKQRLGKIPLVIGMPVMITHNFDVENGVVNGCTGILKSIRYTTDELGNRYAVSCVVESPKISASATLSMLGQNQAVVLQDTIDLIFRHPHSNKKCLIKRTQLPIAPAFAMTAHKAQGQTLNKIIIDLESCRGTESPYVMVSRVTSLEGLLILRPFKLSKIKCHQSQDTRKEINRLNRLRLQTITRIGTFEEKKKAHALLLNENDTEHDTNTKQNKKRKLKESPQNIQNKKIKFQLPVAAMLDHSTDRTVQAIGHVSATTENQTTSLASTSNIKHRKRSLNSLAEEDISTNKRLRLK